ncbi:hypothetical protein ATANTOWER_027875 [Ataeniobius toweri]|uniref:Uncharacterized protein n=1 Tax=Ataeniobius toweri TaxID=208326 RepID=A0ABU7C3Q7_9TELE|nr:hypothetical protein [Ataeniobius toweri]
MILSCRSMFAETMNTVVYLLQNPACSSWTHCQIDSAPWNAGDLDLDASFCLIDVVTAINCFESIVLLLAAAPFLLRSPPPIPIITTLTEAVFHPSWRVVLSLRNSTVMELFKQDCMFGIKLQSKRNVYLGPKQPF